MKSKKTHSIIFSILYICIIIGFIFSFLTMRFVNYSADNYTESTEELQNPYIGWYQIYSYNLADPAPYDFTEILNQDRHAGLVLLEFNLQGFTDCPVSDQGLSFLEQIFKSWQSTGRQLIIRFFYNWDGGMSQTEPQELSLILTHMSQTSEIVNRYSDCIYILQGIFIGPWGEMHSSRYANNDDMITLINHLASVINPEIFLSVRTPQQWRLLAGTADPLDESAAFNGSLASRLGLFNDGMLGSDTDLNTYAAGTRQSELAFQNLLCTYVPNGGEVVIPNPHNDFPAAAEELSTTHVSYLNSAYDDAVLSKWRTETCTEDSPYYGMSGFDYISRHLGYRYVLRSSECASVFPWKKDAEVNVTLQNIGFSNSCRSFDVSLTLKQPDTNQTFTLSAETDTRFWNPNEQVQLKFPIASREYSTGTYDIYLKITDSVSGHPVYLANEGASTEYGFALGSLDISILPW